MFSFPPFLYASLNIGFLSFFPSRLFPFFLPCLCASFPAYLQCLPVFLLPSSRTNEAFLSSFFLLNQSMVPAVIINPCIIPLKQQKHMTDILKAKWAFGKRKTSSKWVKEINKWFLIRPPPMVADSALNVDCGQKKSFGIRSGHQSSWYR